MMVSRKGKFEIISPLVFFVLIGIWSISICDAKFKRKGSGDFPPIPKSMPSKEDMKMMGSTAVGMGSTAMSMFSGPTRITKPEFKFNGTLIVDTVMESVRTQMIKLGMEELHPPDLEVEESGCKAGLFEGKIIGFTNFHRVGDVLTVTEPLKTKFRSAFGFTDISYESGVELKCGKVEYDNGHMMMTCDNVTIYQVYKISHTSQTVDLDEFETSIGDCSNEITGLGEYTAKGSELSNKMMAKGKQPLLDVFNMSFKVAINIGFAMARSAIFAAAG